MSRVFILYVVLLGIQIVTQGLAQQVRICDPNEEQSLLFPYTYFDLEPEGENSRACTPAGRSQDALVCVPRESPTVSYTFLNIEEKDTRIFCVTRNSSRCSEVRPEAGEFDGIAINASLVNSPGSAKIVSGGGTEINIDFDQILNSSLQIESDVCLDVSKKVVLNAKVFYRSENLPGSSYDVCEVLSNGTVVSAVEEFTALITQNPQCKEAERAMSVIQRLSYARTITLVYKKDLPAQPRTATLFLNTAGGLCTSNAPRVSENFNVTVVNNNTSCSGSTPLPPPTGTNPPTELPPGIIAAIVISVPVLVAVGVLTVVAIPLVICLRRRRDQHRANNGPAPDTDVEGGLPNGNGRHQLETLPPPQAGIDDSDSGVGSPGPSTPLNTNCILFVCEDSGDPWYQQLLSLVGGLFNLHATELRLPEDSSSLHDFELKFYDKLTANHYQHLLIIQTHGKSTSKYSNSLRTFISILESRGFHSTKIWNVIIGSPNEVVFPSTVTRLCVTQSPGSDPTSEKCAQTIFEAISSRQTSTANGGTTQDLVSTSLGPDLFSHRDDLKEPESVTSSCPIPRKGQQQETRLFERLVVATEKTAQASESLAKSAEKFANNKSDEGLTQKIGEVKETLSDVHLAVKNVEAIAEDQAERRDKETIHEVSEKSETSSDDA